MTDAERALFELLHALDPNYRLTGNAGTWSTCAYTIEWDAARSVTAAVAAARADVRHTSQYTLDTTVPGYRLSVRVGLPVRELARTIACAYLRVSPTSSAASRLLNDQSFGVPVPADPTIDLLATLLLDAADLPGEPMRTDAYINSEFTALVTLLRDQPDLLTVARAETRLAARPLPTLRTRTGRQIT